MAADADVLKMKLRDVYNTFQTPKTIQEAADDLGWSYHTVRRYLSQLETEGKVIKHGYDGKAATYCSQNTVMPSIKVPGHDDPVPITVFAEMFLRNTPIQSTNITPVERWACLVLYRAMQIRDGEEPITTPAEISEIKRQIQIFADNLHIWWKNLINLLDNDFMWDDEKSVKLFDDPSIEKLKAVLDGGNLFGENVIREAGRKAITGAA